MDRQGLGEFMSYDNNELMEQGAKLQSTLKKKLRSD